ncbi:cytochrome P450 [Periconia macrospinosa]|uniref:Cytochrome P450 n=1 Tax=Periconia macrospinosa TaxID=97972 RepID=A0A2V1E2R7_9PLEO|nr:cytochrome P450 [Periconia macrospinosa]
MLHLLSLGIYYAAICIVLPLLYFLIAALYNLTLHPLRSYPGPKLWAATRLFWARSLQSGYYHQKLHSLHQEYGPVVRIAPNELVYIDAQAWRDIYVTRHGGHHMEKNTVWGKSPPGTPQSIVSTEEDAHLRNRRALTGAFSEHAVSEHGGVVEGYVDLMVRKLSEMAVGGNGEAVVDMVDWFNFLTFDISGHLSFGEGFGSVENGKAHPWVEISCSFGKGLAMVATINFFSPLDKLLRYAIPAKMLEKMEYHKELVRAKLQQRLSMDGEKKHDYVASILEYNKEKGDKISYEEMRVNMTVLIFAGAETTSSALAAILNQLIKNPVALQKLESEIRSAFQHESNITIASVAHLEYLNAVIEEGIRMGPPAAIGPLPRVVPLGGAEICGQWVPAGTHVSINQYPAFRSPTNFTRPDEFVPERFIEGFQGDKLDVFEPFLVGRHKCLGQKLAWAEMRITLARLLYSFDVRPAGGYEVPDYGGQETYIFWEKKPLMISLHLRN